MAQRTALPLAKLQATEQHVEAFKALAHLTRLQVFFFLVRAEREVPAGEIQEAVEVPGPTLSHHLDILRRAGLVAEPPGRALHLLLRPAGHGDHAGAPAHRLLLRRIP